MHALDLDNWCWSKIERIKGPAPRPRADHAVSVAGSELILTGGRGSATKGFSGYYDDVHVLDLAEQARAYPTPTPTPTPYPYPLPLDLAAQECKPYPSPKQEWKPYPSP